MATIYLLNLYAIVNLNLYAWSALEGKMPWAWSWDEWEGGQGWEWDRQALMGKAPPPSLRIGWVGVGHVTSRLAKRPLSLSIDWCRMFSSSSFSFKGRKRVLWWHGFPSGVPPSLGFVVNLSAAAAYCGSGYCKCWFVWLKLLSPSRASLLCSENRWWLWLLHKITLFTFTFSFLWAA